MAPINESAFDQTVVKMYHHISDWLAKHGLSRSAYNPGSKTSTTIDFKRSSRDTLVLCSLQYLRDGTVIQWHWYKKAIRSNNIETQMLNALDSVWAVVPGRNGLKDETEHEYRINLLASDSGDLDRVLDFLEPVLLTLSD